jgi:hypothetical protein
MRPSLIPGLALRRAEERGSRLRRCGAVRSRADFPRRQAGRSADGGNERCAGARPRFPARPPLVRLGGKSDVYDAKADALTVLAACGAPTDKLQIVAGGPNYLHPGRSGTIQLGPKLILGYFGELHPLTLDALDVEGPVAVAEIFLDRLPEQKAKPTKVKPRLELSLFQPVCATSRSSSIAKSRLPRSSAPRRARTRRSDRRTSTCSTSMKARACPRQEVARDRGDLAAARKDAHRCRDRRGREEDRRRSRQEDRRDAALSQHQIGEYKTVALDDFAALHLDIFPRTSARR